MYRIVHFLGIIFLIHSLHAEAIGEERECLMKLFEPATRECPWEIYKSERENALCKYRVLRLVSADENRLNADHFIGYVKPHVKDLYDFESFKERAHNCVKMGEVSKDLDIYDEFSWNGEPEMGKPISNIYINSKRFLNINMKIQQCNLNHPYLSLVEQFDICIGGFGVKELSGALGCLPKQ